MRNFIYNSSLQTFIEGMIREKQALGYKYDSSPRLLYKFDQFCIKYFKGSANLKTKIRQTSQKPFSVT